MKAKYSLKQTKNYRVPTELRAIKDRAYTPVVASIGPLHRHKPELLFMEKNKRMLMSRFLGRLAEPGNVGQNVVRDKCLKVILDLEEEARAWYAEDINFDKYELAEILLIDGCFILEILSEFNLINIQKNDGKPLPDDSLTGNYRRVQTLRHDLMLLENQIPYVVLQKLFDLIPRSKNASIGIPDMSLGEYIYCFFNSVLNLQNNILDFKDHAYCHLIDTLYHACKVTPSIGAANYSHKHSRGFTRSATQLFNSGVQISCNRSTVIPDIRFNEGEISTPQVLVDKLNETLFRNFIALEQTSNIGHYFTSYAKLMRSLTRSSKDTFLLEQLGIITKSDAEMNDTAFFESLCKEVVSQDKDFCFTDLCNEVNDYHIPVWRWRRLKVFFKIKYVECKKSLSGFKSAATLSFTLNFFQTYYTARSYYKHSNG